MDLNQQFELVRQSPTVSLSDRINALKASGRDIVGLQVGDPDFNSPAEVIDVALKAMQSGLTHYGPAIGIMELRKAIAAKLLRDEGVSYDPDSEIMVTHGGIHAYYLAMQSILNPGDDVLIPDPSWATHENMAIMLRGNVIRVPAPRKWIHPFIRFVAESVDHENQSHRVELPLEPNWCISHAEVFTKAARLRQRTRSMDRER